MIFFLLFLNSVGVLLRRFIFKLRRKFRKKEKKADDVCIFFMYLSGKSVHFDLKSLLFFLNPIDLSLYFHF
jgi:hypothetical protein